MKKIGTDFEGLFLLDLEPHRDDRGYFLRSFCQDQFQQLGLHLGYPQHNLSRNSKQGTLRGLHLQTAPHEEIKVITCVAGKVFDVVVDLRPKSKTYLRWFSVELSAESAVALYVPQGFAHGFYVLEDNSVLHYQMSTSFMPEASVGYRWNDPAFGIRWPASPKLVSSKDNSYPDFLK